VSAERGCRLRLERRAQNDLQRYLAGARAERRVGSHLIRDMGRVAQFVEQPLHHRLDLSQDGLSLAPRCHAVLQRLRVPDADGAIARARDELLAVGPPRQ